MIRWGEIKENKSKKPDLMVGLFAFLMKSYMGFSQKIVFQIGVKSSQKV